MGDSGGQKRKTDGQAIVRVESARNRTPHLYLIGERGDMPLPPEFRDPTSNGLEPFR